MLCCLSNIHPKIDEAQLWKKKKFNDLLRASALLRHEAIFTTPKRHFYLQTTEIVIKILEN